MRVLILFAALVLAPTVGLAQQSNRPWYAESGKNQREARRDRDDDKKCKVAQPEARRERDDDDDDGDSRRSKERNGRSARNSDRDDDDDDDNKRGRSSERNSRRDRDDDGDDDDDDGEGRSRPCDEVPAAPVANFTFSCTDLACNFDGSTATAQATATYSWTWGDVTAAGSGKTSPHSYGAAGTYNVTLTVTDAAGSNSKTQPVTVTAPPPGGQTGAVSGMVFEDINQNGLRDGGELGIAWQVTLRTPDGVILLTIMSGADGTYLFAAQQPGSYLVCTGQTSMGQSFPFGANTLCDGIAGYEVTLGAGAQVTGRDFGHVLQ